MSAIPRTAGIRFAKSLGAVVLASATTFGIGAVGAPVMAQPVAMHEYGSLQAFLDVPRSNLGAEHVGGVVSDFPQDPNVLFGYLQQARDQHIAPTRYAALLHQYWLTVATSRANLDLSKWDPQLGLAANQQNLANTFAYYQKLALDHPDFIWTGQGGMAGPSFAAGLMDLDMGRVVLDVREARDIMAGMFRVFDDATAPLTANLPEDVKAVLEVGQHITVEDVNWFQVQVIAMSKHIFMDLIPQHEAYLAGGVPAIEEMYAAGLIDDNALGAWKSIATGTPDGVFQGNEALLFREQYQSVGDQWDNTRNYRGSVGRALTYLSTVAADPAIPGVVPPREAYPMTLTANDFGQPGHSAWKLQAPLPNFNWSVREGRWMYITEQMLPKYRAIKENDPAAWRAAMSVPMDQQIATQRAFARIPAVLVSVARATQITGN